MRKAIAIALLAPLVLIFTACASQALAEKPLTPVAQVVFEKVDDVGVSAKEKVRRDEVARASVALRDISRQREAERMEAEREETERVAAQAEQYADDSWAADYSGYQYADSGAYSGNDFKSQGVVWDGGTAYTWYSQNILPGLAVDGKHVSDDGFVLDTDDRIVVASSDYAKGTELDTPFGKAVVLDYCPTPGVVDVYTDF